jgi:hypothetical protein
LAHGEGAEMTDKLREAAQMALHALQESKPIDIDDPAAFYRSAHAIEALRAALANEFNPDWDAMAVMVEEQQRMAKRIEELESAAQREWQGLTNEDKREIINETESKDRGYIMALVEAKLKEKNT